MKSLQQLKDEANNAKYELFDGGFLDNVVTEAYEQGKKSGFEAGLSLKNNCKDEIKQSISQAITQTREETIREVMESLPLEYHPDGDSEKGYNACLSEIKIKLNKLKK